MRERMGRSRVFIFCGGVLPISSTGHQINDEIRDKEVRLIGADGSQLGIISSREALNIAYTQDLDLVKIAPQATPPVCRIMDYGKFKFEQEKREREARRNQRVIETKEIRLSPGIDVNDLNTKIKNAVKFLGEGDKVKVAVRFRGREMAHTSIGEKLLIQFAEACNEVATVDRMPKLDGRHMIMFLSPKVKAAT